MTQGKHWIGECASLKKTYNMEHFLTTHICFLLHEIGKKGVKVDMKREIDQLK